MRLRLSPDSLAGALLSAWMVALLIASAALAVLAFRGDKAADAPSTFAPSPYPSAVSHVAGGTYSEWQVGTTLLPLPLRLRPAEPD
jgi:hypothetical protein